MTARVPTSLTDSDPAATPAGDQPGDLRAAGYQLIAQIATSAYGPLWAARASGGAEDGRIVLLRRVGKQPRVEPAVLRRVAGAAFAALDVRDPRLAAVLDVVVTDEEVALAIEYVEGELLRSVQRRAGLGNQPLPIPVVLKLALELSRGAIRARDCFRDATRAEPSLRSALHGGLSPDSILLTTYGDPVLLDVGVAGLVLARPEHGMHAEMAPYRAPEQHAAGDVDERSDVFVLGVIVWELLANRPLFGSPRWLRFVSTSEEPAPNEREQALRARHRVLEMPIPRLDAVVRAGAAVPRDVATLVASTLERNPSQRLPSLDALHDALEALGPGRLATSETVGATVTLLASTSIEARRLALSSVTGRVPSDPADEIDSVRPTQPPRASMDPELAALEQLVSSPGALRSLDSRDRKPPPLPRRKGPPRGE